MVMKVMEKLDISKVAETLAAIPCIVYLSSMYEMK